MVNESSPNSSPSTLALQFPTHGAIHLFDDFVFDALLVRRQSEPASFGVRHIDKLRVDVVVSAKSAIKILLDEALIR